ncbi:TonB-dependent receptor [Desertivirga brevis]|uniref:TonB-dependent receptor n=1 Tax=Desertivirga brevis TaxID=2810310 RepID=UPI001A95E1EE|nr:TonB-dependent receptor [Pedobacter sp. SYSU D00873]
MKAIFGLFFLVPLCAGAQVKRDNLKSKSDSSKNLKEVLVNGSAAKILKETPGNIAVIPLKQYYASNITPLQILGQSSGIKIKQDGGYGSRTQFFVNGSTGKQLRFFLDGIPIDQIGETLGLGIVPVEQIERLEIYKGVLPVELGADALGGAINIVTRKERSDFLDASYALGSFQTHRLNLSAKKFWNNNFYSSLLSSAGYAKNNYKIDAGIPNATYNLDTATVRRFHDQFQNFIVRAELGFVNTKWADQFSLSFLNTGFEEQLQNNLLMTQPYGKVAYQERLHSSTLKYQKSNLLKSLDLLSFISYSRVNGLLIDTSRNVYIWNGHVFDRRLKPDEGELGKAKYLHTHADVVNHKVQLGWRILNGSKLSFVNTFNSFRRTGRDTLSQFYNNGIDFYGKPSTNLKNITGLGIESSGFGSRIKFSSSIKHFYSSMSSYQLVDTEHIREQQSIHNWGYNAAFTYNAGGNIILKASFEHALRLPEVEEAFGDFMLIKANPALKPEKSNNANLNVLYSGKKIKAEVSGFFRDIQDQIFLQVDSRGSGMSRNLSASQIKGIEAWIDYQILPLVQLSFNASYQDIRNKGIIDGEPNTDRYYNARVPNIPFLLANGSLRLRKENLLFKGTTSNFWLNTGYTHEYFLYWEVDGAKSLKNRIPTQFIQNAGISISTRSGLSLSLESFNLSNIKTYDNFNVQLPGRSLSIKTRFYIHK